MFLLSVKYCLSRMDLNEETLCVAHTCHWAVSACLGHSHREKSIYMGRSPCIQILLRIIFILQNSFLGQVKHSLYSHLDFLRLVDVFFLLVLSTQMCLQCSWRTSAPRRAGNPASYLHRCTAGITCVCGEESGCNTVRFGVTVVLQMHSQWTGNRRWDLGSWNHCHTVKFQRWLNKSMLCPQNKH